VINLIETLFGLAAVSAVAALIVRWRGRRPVARRLATFGGTCLLLAVVLELYVRYLA
jgi:hypothetical protein